MDNKTKYLHEMKEIVSIRNAIQGKSGFSRPEDKDRLIKLQQRLDMRIDSLFDSLIEYVKD